MKNIIVLYTTLLLLSLFSACTKKDELPVYPTTNPPGSSLTKKMIVGSDEQETTLFTKGTNTISFSTQGYDVNILFMNNDFAVKSYTTNAAPTTDTEVFIMITDKLNSEVYVVESGKEFKIEEKTGSPNYTSISLATSVVNPTIDLTKGSFNVSFTVEQ